MHILHTPLITFGCLLLAVAVLYFALQSIIKYEFEGNASRGLYTFTAIFGVIALIGTVVSLALLIGWLA